MWIATGLVALIAYARRSHESGFRVLPRTTSPKRLLLLRVFALGKRSASLFDAMRKSWLRGGAIAMIAGPDLLPHGHRAELISRVSLEASSGARLLAMRSTSPVAGGNGFATRPGRTISRRGILLPVPTLATDDGAVSLPTATPMLMDLRKLQCVEPGFACMSWAACLRPSTYVVSFRHRQRTTDHGFLEATLAATVVTWLAAEYAQPIRLQSLPRGSSTCTAPQLRRRCADFGAISPRARLKLTVLHRQGAGVEVSFWRKEIERRSLKEMADIFILLSYSAAQR